MKNLILSSVILAAITGCATSPVPFDKATSAPIERVYALQSTPSSEYGTVIVTRDSGYLGGACYHGVYVNGNLVASLSPAEKAAFKVPVGEYLIGVGNPGGKGLCSFNADYRREVSTTVRAGETKRFRFLSTQDGISVEPTSF
ncbi:hypothetical protein [Herbaspirillum autotrophicum]|uniref:hypothetical protein n=1 Tax=Herbaspirillum autotrophicum TaxID=180195 RepID=UPI000B0D92AE|nr:hypothetical protein [Herbaspirillum autotrophicum]